MGMSGIIILGVIVLVLSFAGSCWSFFFYPVLLRTLPRRSSPSQTPQRSPLSVIIPCHNEANGITSKIDKTVLQLNKVGGEILVVDDGSNDPTAAIVLQKSQKSIIPIQLISQNRQGKNAAINQALLIAKYPFVVITDANAVVSTGSFDRLIQGFSDPSVGAIRGKYLPLATTGSYARTATAFRQREHRIFALENERGLLNISGGWMQAFRRELLDSHEIRTMSEDWDLTMGIIRRGYRIWYEPTAVAHKRVSEKPIDIVRQHTRFIYGALQTIWKYRDLLNIWKHGYVSVAILSGKVAQSAAPVWSVIFNVASVILFLQTRANWLLIVPGLSIATGLTGLAAVAFDTVQPRSRFVLRGQLSYYSAVFAATVIAWILFLLRGGRNWKSWSPIKSIR